MLAFADVAFALLLSYCISLVAALPPIRLSGYAALSEGALWAANHGNDTHVGNLTTHLAR